MQGVDDILAMLLACSALPEELELLLIAVTYGNIDVQNCLRNTVSLFHHVEQEIAWRESQGRKVGFNTLSQTQPVVAIGPEHPLADDMLMADFFRKMLRRRRYRSTLLTRSLDGRDGLGGIHESVSIVLSSAWPFMC